MVRTRFGAWLFCLAITGTGSAAAETADAAAKASAAAENLRAAIAALEDAPGARDRVKALTVTIRAYEQGQSVLRDAVRQATIRERALTAKLNHERDRVSALLGVMTGMETAPGPLLLLHPAGPLATARSGMIVADVTPALQAEAERLRTEVEEIAALRRAEEQALQSVDDGLAAVQAARTELSAAISDRTDPPANPADEPEVLAAMISGANTLADVAAALATRPLDREASPAFSDMKGTLPLPVHGTLLRRFGEQDAAGISRPGIILAAAPQALVTAPFPATVRYAGPLLDYGNVIVLEPEADYLLVLAGMATVYGREGDLLAGGDAVGFMGGGPSDSAVVHAEFAAGMQEGLGTDRPETLYVELRSGAEPVDPTGWFAVTRETTE
ncbi:MAG: murein hydrolase activator EnvC family protein [Paracoccaceae bacterium]